MDVIESQGYVWQLPGAGSAPSPSWLKRKTHVLVEHDGPKLVLAVMGESFWIGAYGEYVDESVRWVFSPIGKLELTALASAELPMLSPFVEREVVHAVDFNRTGKPLWEWRIPPNDIPPDMLPVPGEPLPTASREVIGKLLLLIH